MSDPKDYVPFCPLRQGSPCDYRCAWALRVDGDWRMACAAALLAVRGTGHAVNVAPGAKEVTA